MKKILIILIVLVMFLYGCGKQGAQGPSEYDYRTGTEGLTITFPNDLPDKVYANDQNVRFSVQVNNKGAFPQPDQPTEFTGYLWVGGFDPGIISLTPSGGINLNDQELEGKNQYNQNGGFSAVDFNANVYDLPQGTPFYKPNLIFTATYIYKTIANPIVCIDAEPRSTTVREKVCTVGDVSMSSQGAPIEVTNVEEDVTGESILFKISIRNAGDGLVIPEYDVTGNKDPNVGFDWRDLNQVTIEAINVGGVSMSSCRPDLGDKIELVDGNGYIFCKLDKSVVGGKGVYTTPLNIILRYGYVTSVTKTMEIFEDIGY